MNITDVYAEQNAIERMCGVSGVKLTWIDPEDPNQTPRCCLKTKVLSLPKPSVKWTEHERRINRAFMWHENGHLDASQDPLLPMLDREGISMATYLGKVINGLDDVWQEMVTSRRYLGAASDLDYCQAHFCDFGAKMMEQGETTDPFIYKVLGLCYLARSEWQASVNLHVNRFLKFTDISEWEHLVPRINGIIDHHNPCEEMLAIAREMFEADDEAPDEEESADGESDKSENSDETSDEEGEGEASGRPTVSYKDLLAHDHDDASRGESKNNGLKIIYDHDPHDYQPAAPDEFVKGYPKSKLREIYRREITNVLDYSKGSAATIKRLFQSESQTKREYLRKRGKITPKHLTRVVQGDPRIFHRKTAQIDREADVYILVDQSGSMLYDERYAHAASASISLATALESAGIPVKVAGYTTSGYAPVKVEHLTIKDWHDRVDVSKMVDYCSSVEFADNCDGDNLMQSYRELQARGNKRQILIVMSDGQPANMRPGDSDTYLKQVCKFLESKIELYGIGIQTNDVRRYYSHYQTIRSVSEIESTLCDVVSSYLLEKK